MKRFIVPSLLLACGLFLLVGCFYLPTSETISDPQQPDFRKLVGQSVDRPIRPHFVDRRTVQLILGLPHIFSNDHTAIAYSLRTKSGLLVAPLCFMAEREEGPTYLIRFDFDKNDILTSYEVVQAPVIDASYGLRMTDSRMALQYLNRSGSPLLMGGLSPSEMMELRRASAQKFRSTTQPKEKINGSAR